MTLAINLDRAGAGELARTAQQFDATVRQPALLTRV
jgi:hypothetical protein